MTPIACPVAFYSSESRDININFRLAPDCRTMLCVVTGGDSDVITQRMSFQSMLDDLCAGQARRLMDPELSLDESVSLCVNRLRGYPVEFLHKLLAAMKSPGAVEYFSSLEHYGCDSFLAGWAFIRICIRVALSEKRSISTADRQNLLYCHVLCWSSLYWYGYRAALSLIAQKPRNILRN